MSWALLLFGLATGAASAAETTTWHVGDVTYRFTPATSRLEATCAGVTFEPLSGLGPVLAAPVPAPAPALLRVTPRRDRLACDYRCTAADGTTADFSLELGPGAGGLTLRLSSAAARWSRVRGGHTRGLPAWRRVSYTRNAEPYGQPFWPRVACVPSLGLYLAARWDMAASHGSRWDAPDQRYAGEGEFGAALDVLYDPRTDGSRLTLDETLTLRIGRELWATLPPPTQQPSAYREELAQSVFLDVWGGTARETTALLAHLGRLTAGRIRCLTVLENWQAGGFDALLPDSILLPDYPPNPGVGSVAELAELSRQARTLGRFGLRTNYVYLREGSPSARAGRARPALGADGKPQWFTRPADWLALARHQEGEIGQLFATNASFSDQLTSGGGPWSYIDYDARQPEAGSMAGALAQQQELCRLIKQSHRGPLGSETNIDEQLLGEFVDTGDFGIYDGHHRAFTPEFKLRRLSALSVFHGMGLMYRFFEMPPFKAFSTGTTHYLSDPAQYDDYRCAEVLYGNGGYLFYYPGMPWDFVLTECLLVGRLQRYYATQPVRSVGYWRQGRWQTLQELIAAGIDPLPSPWGPQPDELKRLRVEYANGLTVVANRLAEPCDVVAAGTTLRLPQAGWAAWLADGSVLAWSALAPGTTTRMDYLREPGWEYVNPRGATFQGVNRPTLWHNGQVAVQLDPATGNALVDGKPVPWAPPRPPVLTRLAFQFEHDTQGWAGLNDLGPLKVTDGALTAEVVGPDPYLAVPAVDLAPDSVHTIVVRLRATCGTFGQLYFQAEGVKATAEEQCVHFPVTPDGVFHDVRIPVGEHPLWRGHRIVGLRFDPEHGGSPGTVAMAWFRGE